MGGGITRPKVRRTDVDPAGLIYLRERAAVIIGACIIELHLPGNGSLKEKRGILKPLFSQLRRRFNLSTAEIGHNDIWQSAEIAIVTVANDAGRAHAILERAVSWIERHHPQVQVVDWEIEMF